jgi:hypothetical protein
MNKGVPSSSELPPVPVAARLSVCCSRLLLLHRAAPGVVVIVSCLVGSVVSRHKQDA